MTDVKTVDSSEIILDPLLRKKHEDVAKMQASLLACSEDPSLAPAAFREITIRRIYHQLARIIQYTELMDKLEAKLYDSINEMIASLDSMDQTTVFVLLTIQSKLQQNMIESHKLLEPYLNSEALAAIDVNQIDVSDVDVIWDRQTRDRIRTNARQVLLALEEAEVE